MACIVITTGPVLIHYLINFLFIYFILLLYCNNNSVILLHHFQKRTIKQKIYEKEEENDILE